MKLLHDICVFATGLISLVACSCEPPIAFSAPRYDPDSLGSLRQNISAALKERLSQPEHAGASVTIEITSSERILGSWSHAPSAAQIVNGSSVFRGASHSKILIACAILDLVAHGKIASLDDPITQYVGDLDSDGNTDGVDWDKISVRGLMTHVSGILDKCTQRAIQNAFLRRIKKAHIQV